MKLLLYAGCLYLIGIAIVLIIQPSLMFRENGTWKEFGIGRDSYHFTWMPFWLFCVVWALLSYMIMLLMASMNVLPGIRTIESPITDNEEIMNSMSPRQRRKVNASGELKPGYYILDMEETGKKGVPKYVFLGEEAPNLIYNRG
jgi:hypothetical protein|uniref:Uncharacterized protein n=1 Tax=viral metagenome TaxID=1070528 RepID=A0A6C0DIA3_9ZZZZ